MNHQGYYIKSLIKERGTTQEIVGKHLNLSRPTIGKRLDESVYPNTDELVEIIKFLNLTQHEIDNLNKMKHDSITMQLMSMSNLSNPVQVSEDTFKMTVDVTVKISDIKNLYDLIKDK